MIRHFVISFLCIYRISINRLTSCIFSLVLLESDKSLILGIVLFGNDQSVNQGSRVNRTYSIVSIPVGDILLGRVLDCLGNFIDGIKLLNTKLQTKKS
jgi:F0F1-type ATP synthase alpha subunit